MTEEEKQVLAEAPASLNFRCYTAKGYELQVTLRDMSEFALMERLKKFWDKLDDLHITPKPAASQPAAPAAAAHIEKAIAEVTGGTLPPPAAKSAPQPAQAQLLEFAAETLEGSMNKGKVYWKVKGGQYNKYGVTVWPEVLATAFDPTTLDPATIYNMKGYTARYQMGLNDKGVPVPEKVVELIWNGG